MEVISLSEVDFQLPCVLLNGGILGTPLWIEAVATYFVAITLNVVSPPNEPKLAEIVVRYVSVTNWRQSVMDSASSFVRIHKVKVSKGQSSVNP
ncbi:hypothetical protein [uncultured Nostoc sp.]|uniref:hypothetical protein n=1 Tax=uncultured Nostoc sp. TaxID=340711 RepID=UPI0035CAFE9A